MELFDRCLQSLRNASTDTEKFAALLLVTKVFKSDTLPNSVKRELFQAIGSTFLKRLLRTNDIPEGCPTYIFKSIAFAVLASLCSETDREVISVVVDNVDIIKEVLASHPENPEERVMIDDALLCINFATSDVTVHGTMIKQLLLDTLVELYMSDTSCSGKALQVFLSLLVQSPQESWASSEEAISRLLAQLAVSFHAEQTHQKFDTANLLTSIIATQPTVKDLSNEDWILPIQDGIYELITSSAFKSYRSDIFKLAGVLTERYHVSWFGISKNDRSSKLVALLIHLVSIEIRMILENRSLEEIQKDSALLLSCYHILECFISVNNERMWELIQKQTERMLTAITLSINAVISFLLSVSPQWNCDENLEAGTLGRDLTYATIRLLCSWLAEESVALRKEVCEVLPFILQVAEESISEENASEESYDKPDLLRFLLAPLCHLSADDLTRTVLMKHNVPTLLIKYMQCKFSILCQQEDSSLEDSLSTVCGVLLNIVVMEGATAATDKTFNSLFKFLHYALPRLSTENKCLVLQANFSVLGLLIAKHQFEQTRFKDVQFHKFLSASVKFLWNAHELTYTSDFACLTLAPEYQDIWNDIMELWFLGLQALVSILSLVSWIGGFLLTSGWPQHIVQSFKSVPNQYIESSVKLAFQNLLCCLMKNCPDNTQPLIEQGISDVARLHALKELESLLKIIQSKA